MQIVQLDPKFRAGAIQAFYEGLGSELSGFELPLEAALKSFALWGLETEGGEIVGLTGLRRKGYFFDIFFVVVHRNHQGVGWGRKLSELGLNTKNGLRPVLLSVKADNRKARDLYRSLNMGVVLCTPVCVIMLKKVGFWRWLTLLAQLWVGRQN